MPVQYMETLFTMRLVIIQDLGWMLRGKSKYAMVHYGQLMNEFPFNAQALDNLYGVYSKPADDNIHHNVDGHSNSDDNTITDDASNDVSYQLYKNLNSS